MRRQKAFNLIFTLVIGIFVMMVELKRRDQTPHEVDQEFMDKFKEIVTKDEPLSAHNTFGTGGNARLFANVRSAEQLSAVIQTANELKIPFFMLGGGSNMLISDKGYDGLIIKNGIDGLMVKGTEITAGAGENLQALVDCATDNSLTGMEFAAGIWGTVGGAIFGNAGAYGSEIGSVMTWAELVDREGRIRIENSSYFAFAYRTSKLKVTREFVTRAGFGLKQGEKEEIRSKVDEIVATRKEKLPEMENSAGCFFKNIVDKREKFGKLPAGKLLEEIGAKEMHIGGAHVYSKHANIIINDGTASSREIHKLGVILKKRVQEKFGIELAEEITLLGNFEEENL